MQNLTWKDYVGAIGSDNIQEYYKNIYGSWSRAASVLEYHMSEYKPRGLDGIFTLVKSIDGMVFGQFIACELALTSGFEKPDALIRVSQNAIRPIEDVVFDNTDVEKERRHINDVLSFTAPEILHEVENYIKLRDEFVNVKYNGVFYIANDDDETVNNEEEEELDQEQSEEDEFSKKWYWYAIIRSLSNDNIFDYERVMMTQMSVIAPELAYRRHKQIVEDIRERRRKLLNRY